MDPFEIAASALGGVGLGAQVFGLISGNSSQKQLMNSQLAQERMIAQRDRLQQVRQMRAAIANTQQAGANMGVSGSSSITTGASSSYDQGGQNIQYINNQQAFGAAFTSERQAINSAQGIEQLGSDVFNIAGKVATGGF